MAELQDLQSAVDFFEEFSENISPYIEWLQGNWFPLVLSGEIVGAVMAVKLGRYRERGYNPPLTVWTGYSWMKKKGPYYQFDDHGKHILGPRHEARNNLRMGLRGVH